MVCAIFIELAYRALSGVSVLTLANWRDRRVAEADLKAMVQYDPTLGWTVASGVRSSWMNTVDYGLRRNTNPAGARLVGRVTRFG